MNKRLGILVALTVVIMGAGVTAMGVFSNGQAQEDKPILYMTPSDIFQNRGLRQLAEAAQQGNVKDIDALIAQGVNVNGHGKYGIGPLFSAVRAGNKAGFKALLDRGANPNNVWTNGYTLMNDIACCTHDPYFMEQALKHGANPNLVEPHTGMTPIMAAVTVSGKVNVPPLIKAGADLNHQIPSGKGSPLFPIGGETAMMGATGDMFDVVYELLGAGADYRLKDDRGWNLAAYVKDSFRGTVSSAQADWRNKVIEFLKQHNAWSGDSGRESSQVGNAASQSEAATSAAAPLVTNYEASGNLQATRKIGCVDSDELSNEDTPADLYPALIQCLKDDKYEQGVFIYALAGVYTRFDTLRVADKSAHDAGTVFLSQLDASVPRDKLKQFDKVRAQTVNDDAQLSHICAQVKKIGPPAYYPRYMVQHGMQAFTGLKNPKGLVPDFDEKQAWSQALKDYLGCP